MDRRRNIGNTEKVSSSLQKAQHSPAGVKSVETIDGIYIV